MKPAEPGQRERLWWTRWALRAAMVLTVVGVLIAVVVWLAFQHIPSWYRPIRSSPEIVGRARASLPGTYQSFTDLLNAGRAFEFRLSAQTVNEWIAARADIWPESADALPPEVHDPMVAFDDERMILAARLERGDWKLIASAHLRLVIEGEQLRLFVAKTGAGSLPIPRGRLAAAIEGSAERVTAEREWAASVGQVLGGGTATTPAQLLGEGWVVPNRLFWSNGERYFRLTQVRADDGELVLGVEPL